MSLHHCNNYRSYRTTCRSQDISSSYSAVNVSTYFHAREKNFRPQRLRKPSGYTYMYQPKTLLNVEFGVALGTIRTLFLIRPDWTLHLLSHLIKPLVGNGDIKTGTSKFAWDSVGHVANREACMYFSRLVNHINIRILPCQAPSSCNSQASALPVKTEIFTE
jgi:hypothetical protein